MSLTTDHKGTMLSSHFPEETEAEQLSNLPEVTTVVFRRVNLIVKLPCIKASQRLPLCQDKVRL